MDEIRISGLKIFANHGVYNFEKEKGQHFVINATLFLSLCKAGASDDLNNTVNYAECCEFIQNVFTQKSYDLIETTANELAYGILKKYPTVEKVEIEVCKPEAPITIPFDNVSVFVSRARHTAFIAVGSNLGESKNTIEKGKALLVESGMVNITKESSLIVTKPYGVTDQPDFLNGMWKVETFLEPYELLDLLNDVEKKMGRERLVHWGPRTLDLDIIYYDDCIIDTERLTVPHIDMANREFVLKPLMEVDNFKRHPISRLRAEEMLEKIGNK